MGYHLLAELILLLHILFVCFVLFGGLLSLRRRYWTWLHLPAVFWGIWVEWANWLCPLTPLENYFRQLASGRGYSGGFIEHYLSPLLYPANLTNTLQWFLGGVVLTVNLTVYAFVIRKSLQRKTRS